MSDELERIRSLRDHAPAPSDDWARQTRAELLAMATEEAEVSAGRAAADPGWMARWRRRLGVLVAGPGRAVAAGAALLAAVVAVGVVLTTAGPQEPTEPVAGPTDAPESTEAPGSGSPSPPDADDGPTSAAEPGNTDGPDPDADDGPRSSAEPEDDPAGGERLAASCEREDGTYAISYPEGWHTNTGDVAAPCQYFDQEPVELAAGTGGVPEHPVTVQIVPLPLGDSTEPGPGERRTARTATTVAGRDAVVVEATATGAGAMPEGTRSYRYLIDLDGERTLLVAAYDLTGDGLTGYRELVDDMVASLRFGDG